LTGFQLAAHEEPFAATPWSGIDAAPLLAVAVLLPWSVTSIAYAGGARVLDGRRLGDGRPRNGRDQFGNRDSEGVGESDHSRQAGAVFAALYPAIGSHVDTDELSEFDLSELPPLSDVPQLLAEEVRDGLLATRSGEGPNR
jgi:hypothetical protein